MSGHVKRGALIEERWKVSKLKHLPAEGMGVSFGMKHVCGMRLAAVAGRQTRCTSARWACSLPGMLGNH